MSIKKGHRVQLDNQETWYQVARVSTGKTWYIIVHGLDGVIFDRERVTGHKDY